MNLVVNLVVIGIVAVIVIILYFDLFMPTSKTDSKAQSSIMQKNDQPNIVQSNTLMEQQKLTDHYANSKLLVEILDYICKGDYKENKPREIIISHDNIKSDISGKTIVFDFVSNRVPVFEYVSGFREDALVKPQVAFAEAINRLMGNEYEIIDRAEINIKETSQKELLVFYKSNYVQMRLKATKKF